MVKSVSREGHDPVISTARLEAGGINSGIKSFLVPKFDMPKEGYSCSARKLLPHKNVK
jgi:hypothetical protein